MTTTDHKSVATSQQQYERYKLPSKAGHWVFAKNLRGKMHGTALEALASDNEHGLGPLERHISRATDATS